MQTKSDIKNRMIKKAAEMWGVTPSDIDSTFDPVVSLLIGACATELSKISGDISNSQNRIAEKLIDLISPNTVTGAKPAHAIVHAMPVEPHAEVLPADQLIAKKRIKNLDGNVFFKKAYFSPIKNFKLVNAHIQYALTGNTSIQFEKEKKVMDSRRIRLADNATVPEATLFLGIPKTETKTSLKNTNIYFEIGDMSYQELFYNQLKQAEFYYNDQPIEISFGLRTPQAIDRDNINEIFSSGSQKNYSAENETESLYKKNYVKILSDCLLNKPVKSFDFLSHIDLEEHEDFKEYQWLKIVFPSTVSIKMLSNIYAALNTFPALNRRLENTSYSLKEFSNIVPFSSSDIFLDVKKVSNDSGKTYSVLTKDNTSKKGTFAIRDKNISRLDSRKAKDYLINLLDLLKNESAAFSTLGYENLQSNILKLNQNISALEDRVSEMNIETEEVHYLSLNPYYRKETIFIDYWTTIGEEANLLKVNTKLEVYKGVDIDAQKCFLVTSSQQGKNSLSEQEKLFSYRRALLSRDRIVTKEDVKALCFDICGTKIESVTLSKEFKTHFDYNKGLIPTIVITIKRKNDVKTKDNEWIMIKNNILSVLKEKATSLFPYYIKLTN